MSSTMIQQRFHERKAKARRIVQAGGVAPQLSSIYTVQSQQDQGSRYCVDIDAPSCDCPDGWGRLHLGVCKHILAVLIYRRKPANPNAQRITCDVCGEPFPILEAALVTHNGCTHEQGVPFRACSVCIAELRAVKGVPVALPARVGLPQEATV